MSKEVLALIFFSNIYCLQKELVSLLSCSVVWQERDNARGGNVGVDSWVSFESAAISPRNDASEETVHGQWATGISLAGIDTNLTSTDVAMWLKDNKVYKF